MTPGASPDTVESPRHVIWGFPLLPTLNHTDSQQVDARVSTSLDRDGGLVKDSGSPNLRDTIADFATLTAPNGGPVKFLSAGSAKCRATVHNSRSELLGCFRAPAITGKSPLTDFSAIAVAGCVYQQHFVPSKVGVVGGRRRDRGRSMRGKPYSPQAWRHRRCQWPRTC